MESSLQQKLNDLKQKNLLRTPKGEWGQGFTCFTSNDYLGLSRHAEVAEAAIKATEKYGAGAQASRYAGGNHPLIEEFEECIAAYKGYGAACVFGSGYLANLGVLQILLGKGDVVVADKLAHACMIDGAALSGAKLVRFRHNNVEGARRKAVGAKLVMTEEIFSMDGDKAPLAELAGLGVPLMVDGAHSLYEPEKAKADIYVGTMSKALGSYGGYVCGSKVCVDYIKATARTQIYSTALPPSVIAAAIAALGVIERERPYLRTLKNAEYLCGLLKLPFNGSAIIPVVLGSEEAALKAEGYLKERKILVSAIRPPTVPKNTSRLRVSVTANHTKAKIEKLAKCLLEITKESAT